MVDSVLGVVNELLGAVLCKLGSTPSSLPPPLTPTPSITPDEWDTWEEEGGRILGAFLRRTRPPL